MHYQERIFRFSTIKDKGKQIEKEMVSLLSLIVEG